jgi:hypothetical protein
MAMRRISWVIIGIAVIGLAVAAYVLIAHPVIVLPTYVVPQESSPILAYQQKLNINQLDVKIRTDGKVTLVADGKEVGYVSYNLGSLMNAIRLAEKTALPKNTVAGLGVVPLVFPELVSNLRFSSQTLYFVLPVEMTLRFVRG